VRKTTKLIEGGHRGLLDCRHIRYYFYVFFTFFNPKSHDFLRFLPCFVRFLEVWSPARRKERDRGMARPSAWPNGKHARVLDPRTFLCSSSSVSHMAATILDISPKLALGFWHLIAAWVSRKNSAYAETGLQHGIGHVIIAYYAIMQPYNTITNCNTYTHTYTHKKDTDKSENKLK